MCQGMVNIQSPTAEIRQGKKERKKEERKKQDENIMVYPVTQGDHNESITHFDILTSFNKGLQTISELCTRRLKNTLQNASVSIRKLQQNQAHKVCLQTVLAQQVTANGNYYFSP